MGLDITAYSRLHPVADPEFDEDNCLVDWENQWLPGASMEWSEKAFPGRGEGVDAKTVYSWEDIFEFRAGSYSGYNEWRDYLDRFKGDVAFQELINFADNEGVIGPVVSKKLAQDFTKYAKAARVFAKKIGEDETWWIKSYNHWWKAFKMASDNGAVDFH